MYVQTTQFFIAVDAKDQIQQENDQTKYLTDTHTHTTNVMRTAAVIYVIMRERCSIQNNTKSSHHVQLTKAAVCLLNPTMCYYTTIKTAQREI